MVETVSAQLLSAGKSGGAAPQGLEPGTELRAKVEANLPNGVVRLTTADAKVDLRVPSPLPVGGDVTVTVSGSKQQPTVQITTSNSPATPPPPNGSQSAGQAKPASVPTPQQPPATGNGALSRPAPVLAQILQAGGALPVGSNPTANIPANTVKTLLQALPVGTTPTAPTGSAPAPQTPVSVAPPGNSTPPPTGSPAGNVQPQQPQQPQQAQARPPQSAASLPASNTASVPPGSAPASAPNVLPPTAALPTGSNPLPTSAQTTPPVQAGNTLPNAGATLPQALPAGAGQNAGAQGAVPLGSGAVPAQSSGQPISNLSANSQVIPPPPGPQSAVGQGATAPQGSVPLPQTGSLTGSAQGARPQTILNTPQAGQLASGTTSTVLQSGGARTSLYPVQGTPQAVNAGAQAASAANSPLQQAANVVRQPLAEQQAGVGALFAQIGSLMAVQGAAKVSLPDSVQKAMQQILGLRVGSGQTGGQTGTQGGAQSGAQGSAQSGLAQNLQKAVLQSGQFREASLLRPGSDLPGAQTDLKSALLSFKGLLQRFGAEAQIVKPAQQPSVPSKKGGPQGQAQHAARGASAGSAPQVLQSLLQDTDAALARMRLTQLVNSGLAGDDGPQTASSRPMDVVLELPLALGQETAVMQMQVGRDGGGSDGDEDGEPAWRLRFALDLTATGPLEAAISLRGGGTYVSLWVDRKDTLEALKGVSETMEAAFAHAGLDLQELRFIRGLPPRTAAKYGALIDRQS
ncbi:MAG: flagellar hook-length control protein FliK [Roseibium sp.]